MFETGRARWVASAQALPPLLMLQAYGTLDMEIWARHFVIDILVWGLLDNVYRLVNRTLGSLDEAVQQAEQANSAKSDFLANISHEIRTPLNGIFGSLQIIDSSRDDPESVKRFTDLAMASYQSVISIVNDILDISKIREGKFQFHPEPNRVGDIVGMVCSELAQQARAKSVKLEFHLSDEVLDGNRMIDAVRFSQVLRNLISNAVKFTDEGQVSVDVTRGWTPDEVLITVRDTGAGIAPDKLGLIFEPFEQAQPGRRTERRGTGLGLAITKRLVEMMDGEIEVSSVEGAGTTFTVRAILPLTDQQMASDEPDVAPTRAVVGRILLAEDVATNRFLFNALLKDEDVEVTEAVNGEEAVEKALHEEFDAIFWTSRCRKCPASRHWKRSRRPATTSRSSPAPRT